MDNRPILFLDSGIGGILYCRDFARRNPREAVVYLADPQHFPYGKRKAQELVLILFDLVEKMLRVAAPKLVVLACNTASVSALEELRERFPSLPFVGTVPAIKPAALASRKKIVGILGTERTIEAPYMERLASECSPCKIHGIAAPDLVEFVERRLEGASADEKREIVVSYLERFRAFGVDALVLGCTHFLFLLDVFRREAEPDILVFDSIDGVTRQIEALLDKNGLRSLSESAARNRMILTGTEIPDKSWQAKAQAMSFDLCLLQELIP
jgi:glutamate racemase